MDAITALGDRVIAYRPVLRSMGVASSVTGTLLASQLLWEYQQAGRNEFSLTDAQLSERTAMTIDEVRIARNDVLRCGFFTYARRGMPAVGHYQVEAAKINDLLGKPLAPQQSGPEPEQVRVTARTSSGNHPNKFGPEPEQSIYIETNRRIEIPLVPLPQTATVAPEPAAVPKARRVTTAKDRFASRVLPTDAVPSDLLDCQQLLPEWWLVKGKGRTEGAFNVACRHLRKYSPDERRQILETAIMGGHQGLYAPRDGPKAYAPRKSQTSQAVDNVLAFLDANPHLA